MVGLKNDVIKHSSKLKFYIIIYAGRPPCKGDVSVKFGVIYPGFSKVSDMKRRNLPNT